MLTLNIDWPWEEVAWASDFSELWEQEDLGLFPILPLNRYITLNKVPLTKSTLNASNYMSKFIFKHLNMQIFMNDGVKLCRESGYWYLNMKFGTQRQAFTFQRLILNFYVICKGNKVSSYLLGRGHCKARHILSWRTFLIRFQIFTEHLWQVGKVHRHYYYIWAFQWCFLCEAFPSTAGWSSSQ